MKVFSVFTKQGKVDIQIKDKDVAAAEAVAKDPILNVVEKVRELSDLANKLTKAEVDALGNKVEKISFKDVDGRVVTIEKGGPGSGCQGPNCGRPAGSGSGVSSKDIADVNNLEDHKIRAGIYIDSLNASDEDKSKLRGYVDSDKFIEHTLDRSPSDGTARELVDAQLGDKLHKPNDNRDLIVGQNFARLNVPYKHQQAIKDYMGTDKFHNDVVAHHVARNKEVSTQGHAMGPHPAVRAINAKLSSLGYTKKSIDALRDVAGKLQKGGPGSGCQGPNCGRPAGSGSGGGDKDYDAARASGMGHEEATRFSETAKRPATGGEARHTGERDSNAGSFKRPSNPTLDVKHGMKRSEAFKVSEKLAAPFNPPNKVAPIPYAVASQGGKSYVVHLPSGKSVNPAIANIKQGSTVQFANPGKGEENLKYEVLEHNGDRVLVRPTGDHPDAKLSIPPTQTLPLHEFVPSEYDERTPAQHREAKIRTTQESLDQGDSLKTMEQADKYDKARAAGMKHEDALRHAGANPKDLVRPVSTGKIPREGGGKPINVSAPSKEDDAAAEGRDTPGMREQSRAQNPNSEIFGSNVSKPSQRAADDEPYREPKERRKSIDGLRDLAGKVAKGGPGSGCQGPNCGRPKGSGVTGGTGGKSDAYEYEQFLNLDDENAKREYVFSRERGEDHEGAMRNAQDSKASKKPKGSMEADQAAFGNLKGKQLGDYKSLSQAERTQYADKRSWGWTHAEALEGAKAGERRNVRNFGKPIKEAPTAYHKLSNKEVRRHYDNAREEKKIRNVDDLSQSPDETEHEYTNSREELKRRGLLKKDE